MRQSVKLCGVHCVGCTQHAFLGHRLHRGMTGEIPPAWALYRNAANRCTRSCSGHIFEDSIVRVYASCSSLRVKEPARCYRTVLTFVSAATRHRLAGVVVRLEPSLRSARALSAPNKFCSHFAVLSERARFHCVVPRKTRLQVKKQMPCSGPNAAGKH